MDEGAENVSRIKYSTEAGDLSIGQANSKH